MAFGAVILGTVFAAGALLAAAIVSNSLSEGERQKQQKMREDYDSYCSGRREQYKSTVSSYRRTYEEKESEFKRNYAEERRLMTERLKEANRPYIDELKKNLAECREKTRRDLDELEDVLKRWDEHKKTAQSTSPRMKALKRSILTIEEACYKLRAYFEYLRRYEHNMDHCFERFGTIPEPFSMTLPDYFPYPGKIYRLKKSDFYLREGKYTYNIPDEKNLTLWLSKYENELFEQSDQPELAVAVLYNKNEDKLAGTVSITKAAVKESAGGRQGLYAEVTDVTNSHVKLLYNNVQRLRLQRSMLINKFKKTPKGSYLTVYVTDYDFALKTDPAVSEKIEDGLSLASFENIAMTLPYDERKKLYGYLAENNWLDRDDEWRIGPASKEDPPRLMKLQLGDLYGYLAEFVDHGSDGKFLEFRRLLKREEFFTFTDIFAAAEVTVRTCVDTKITNFLKLAEEGDFLYSYLCSEFASQAGILKRSEMMLYFEKWLELTNRLIEVLIYKERITVEIESWERHGKDAYLYLKPDNSYIRFLERCFADCGAPGYENGEVPNRKSGRKPHFLIQDTAAAGKPYLMCFTDKPEDGEPVSVFVKDLPVKHIEEMDYRADLIVKSFVGAELRQAAAFSDFREGRVSSSALKEIILGSSLKYHDTGLRIGGFYNSRIGENEKQFEAINKAFSVEDFFMIQGPPGTGKTTVIRELIMQQLHMRSDSRILIVSQANVAVDNVLRGIKEFCQTEESGVSKNQIIRCGSDDRIAEDIKEFSFDGRLRGYEKELEASPCGDPRLRAEWLRFVRGNKDIVGECLLRGYQIIGATCVGFAGRNIGLTGMEFDLVIIDEAGKALPGELLIPINHAKKLIMIGDHKQLPPVINPALYKQGEVLTSDVIEEEEREDFFNKSFFERMWEKCPDSNKCMLDRQFRMPPMISGLVNLFYDGKLKDGEGCSKKYPIAFDSNLVMLDMNGVSDYQESQKERFGLYNLKERSGPYNLKEQETAVKLIRLLREVYSGGIVVITPYKNQKRQLIAQIRKNGLKNVRIDTIDAFQGDEENIVIYCMTRARHKTGYFSDSARLNVAFSRAKNLLIIIGSSSYLRSYGKEHILYKVHNYIRNNVRIIPYEEFDAPGFSAANQKSWSCEAESIAAAGAAAFSETQRDALFTVPDDETVEAERLCEACGKPIADGEEILCINCLNESEIIRCSRCGNEFEFPNYLKYIEKAKKPHNCPDCADLLRQVDVVCDCCGKKFTLQNRVYREKVKKGSVYCGECLKKVTINCGGCGKEVTMPRHIYQKISQKGSVFCGECLKKITVRCDCCTGTTDVLCGKYLQLHRAGKRCLCPNCQNDFRR